MEYTITALNGDSVKIESGNWMSAMGKALGFFDIAIESVEKLICSSAKDGSVFIEDAGGMRSWMVREIAPQIQIRVTDSSPLETWEPLQNDPTDPGFDLGSPPPDIAMPTDSSLRPEGPESVAERVFDLSMEIAAADVDEACRLSLAVIMEYVNVEAGSVARGTLSDKHLVFVTATGPVAEQIVGREVSFGEGLVGMCFDMRGTLLVNDVARDTRHLDQFDLQTGFETLSVLCVPILDDANLGYGVIQLINPPGRQFQSPQIDLAEMVAKILANSLANR